MKSEKHKIVFDSNILYYDLPDYSKVFNSNLLYIKDFLKKNKISKIKVAIPELVVKERLSQRLEGVENDLTKIEIISEKFKGLKARQQFKVLKELKSKDYKKILEAESDNFVKKNSIEIIPTINIDQQILINRSMGKVLPFKKGDKGFKDTIIWLSILDDAEKNKDGNYIFCTNNISDFIEEDCKNEFRKHSKKDFVIVKDINDLKEYLDKKFVLKLALKALNKRIEDELKQKVGTITTKAISYILMDKSHLFGGLGTGYGLSIYGSQNYGGLYSSNSQNDISKFDFLDMDISNISKTGNNIFNVNIQLILQKERSHKDSREELIHFYSMSLPNNKKRLSIELEYRRNKKEIEIISAQEVEL